MPANNEDIVAELQQTLALAHTNASDAESVARLGRAIALSNKLAEQLAACPICYQPLMNPETTQCGHVFCKNCLRTWKRQSDSCPSCRQNISTRPPVMTEASPARAAITDLENTIRDLELSFNAMQRLIQEAASAIESGGGDFQAKESPAQRQETLDQWLTMQPPRQRWTYIHRATTRAFFHVTEVVQGGIDDFKARVTRSLR